MEITVTEDYLILAENYKQNSRSLKNLENMPISGRNLTKYAIC